MYEISELLLSGLALVPIPYGRKGPNARGWNEQKNVITDIVDESLLQDKNIGLAHAYCTPNPTCAIDVDDYKESKKWLAMHRIDLDELLFSSDAVAVHSGRVNSLKLLYRLPAGIVPMPSKSIKTKANTMMLEFRCASVGGLTVQDVLPPSIHPSGTSYQWIGNGSALLLPIIPTQLLDIWISLTNQKTKSINILQVNSPTPETPRQIARVQDMLSYVPADCDYEVYRNTVWSILSTGWKVAEHLAESWSLTAPHRFEQKCFDDLVHSHNPSLQSTPTLGTLTHLARAGGWNG